MSAAIIVAQDHGRCIARPPHHHRRPDVDAGPPPAPGPAEDGIHALGLEPPLPPADGVERAVQDDADRQRRGWVTGTFTLYGKPAAKRYKTFVATWRPAGGAIRVVLV